MLYSVKMFDKPDSEGLRDATRQPHLDYLKTFDVQTWFGGPMLADDGETALGSHRLMDFASREDAQAHVRDEPYVVAGLQSGVEIIPWSNSVAYTWRDCPRTKDYIQFLIMAYDKPDSDALREALRDEHVTFQTRVSDLYLTRGPLLDEARQRQIGSLMIVDVPDVAAGHEFWAGEPFNTGGLFERVEMVRWRFGRVFDQTKPELQAGAG